MEHEYPQYYEVQDPAGDAFALVAVETETIVTVIQKREVPNSFIVSRVNSLQEVGSIAPGQILGVHAIGFEETLMKQWRFFGLSQEVVNATVAAGVDTTPKAEPNALDTPKDPEPVDPEVCPPAVVNTPAVVETPDATDSGDAGNSEAPATDEDGSGLSEPAAEANDAGTSEGEPGTASNPGTGADTAPAKPDADTGGNPGNVLPEGQAKTG